MARIDPAATLSITRNGTTRLSDRYIKLTSRPGTELSREELCEQGIIFLFLSCNTPPRRADSVRETIRQILFPACKKADPEWTLWQQAFTTAWRQIEQLLQQP